MPPTEPGKPTAEEVEALTREILSRPIFERAPREPSLWERFMDWLNSLSLGNGSGFDPDLLTILLWVVVIAAVGFLLYALINQISAGNKTAVNGRAGATVALEGAAETWEEAIDLVDQALARGDRHRAVWILHRLVLGLLDERGELTFARWKTNSDYLAEVPAKAEHRDLLEALTRAYEAIVYAHAHDEETDLGQFAARARAMRGGA